MIDDNSKLTRGRKTLYANTRNCAVNAVILVLNIIGMRCKSRTYTSKSDKIKHQPITLPHNGFSQVSVLCVTADAFKHLSDRPDQLR